MKIIDGNRLAQLKEAELKEQVVGLKSEGVVPQLAVLVMKDDEAGQLYSRLKQEACERVGIGFQKMEFEPQETERMLAEIEKLNADSRVQGMMVQRPGVSWGKKQGMNRQEFETWWQKIVKAIDLKKDVDGLRQESAFLLATVKAVAMVLASAGIKSGRMVVVGSQGLMGRRLVDYFQKAGFTVQGVDVEEENLAALTRGAEIVVSATGQENLIKAAMIKEGAVVIDVGWPKGDVDFKAVKEKAGLITPVPGGIGPLTVVSLLENLVDGLRKDKEQVE